MAVLKYKENGEWKPVISETDNNASGQMGDIVMTLKTAPSPGRLFMNGHQVQRADYPAMYDFVAANPAYGTVWGTYFMLKNMSARVPAGHNSSGGTFGTLGDMGGAETHTLTLAQIPNRTGEIGLHSSHEATNIASVSGVFSSGRTNTSYKSGGSAIGGANSIGIARFELGGGGQEHNNLQPYVVVNYEVVAV